jgi:hypothetical protein
VVSVALSTGKSLVCEPWNSDISTNVCRIQDLRDKKVRGKKLVYKVEETA